MEKAEQDSHLTERVIPKLSAVKLLSKVKTEVHFNILLNPIRTVRQVVADIKPLASFYDLKFDICGTVFIFQ